MKVCFIGIGSIAKRHIRNLRAIFSSSSVDNAGIVHVDTEQLRIDALRRTDEAIDGVDKVYTDFNTLPCDYDAIFITNPTELHLETLKRVYDKGRHFFIEKPVVSVHQINEAQEFLLSPDSYYYVACPLRYNAVIQWIKSKINPSDVISVRSISSSYLPDWRPGQDYRKTYSAHREMGGGVSIDLIHEWDYLTYLFGWPKQISSFIGKKSGLEIDSDDYAIYMAEYEDKIVELHLDYFGRKMIREIQLFTKNETIIGDIASNQVRFLGTKGAGDAEEIIDFHEERDDYHKRELLHFFDLIQASSKKEEEFTHAIDVLALTQGILCKREVA